MSMTYPVKIPKKLIEVALPLDKINEAAAREKSIRHGHPSTLHLWWARRPLAAARAVIFGQMVNDPSWKWEMQNPGEIPPSNLKASWVASRKRLFAILEELVKWENTTNEEVLEKARSEIRKSWRETCDLNKDHPQAAKLFNSDKLPGLHDPFAGGGAIPLAAQRLGFEASASDLNPVAVLINKAMIEIPPKFAGKPPINPDWRRLSPGEKLLRQWQGAQGLAEDVRYYGQWMRDEAQKRIGYLYPLVEITSEIVKDRPDLRPFVGRKLTVVAWLWVRTVKSPNPAFRHVEVPLASTFLLSSKPGKEAYIYPVVEGDRYSFSVKKGKPPPEAKNGTKLARGANFRCLVSGAPIEPGYVYAEANAGRMGERLMAIVAEGNRGRAYIAPTSEHISVASRAKPDWKPSLAMPDNPRWFSPPLYGLKQYGDLFTPRQLVALTTFSDLVAEASEKIRRDALETGMPDDGGGLNTGSVGATAYAEAVGVYLAFGSSRAADAWSSIVTWRNQVEASRNTFARQAVPMTWDFTEVNPFSSSCGNWTGNSTEWVEKSLLFLPQSSTRGVATQDDAQRQSLSLNRLVSTDPPYYDNVGYADLSDFFYVWLRRALKPVFPDLFATLAVPKTEELVATPYRHGSKGKAEIFFLDGMTQAMQRLATQAHPAAPITIYYAFKQSESESDSGTTSTGWETFLEAVHRSGLVLTGTWPMRTEKQGRVIEIGNNALASSIVLVCRPRLVDALTTSRRAFLRELNQVLPEALDEMTRGAGDGHSPVAPVDFSQAIIGPGMAVFSKYAAVLEADGTPMRVRMALQLINRFIAEDDFDHDTQFCLHWFEQHGWAEGRFGEADTLARAKGTSVEGIKQAGVLYAAGGVVRLLKWADYPANWDPPSDSRLPIWEALHQLIRVFKSEGESGAGAVVAAVQAKAEAARQLAYRLYTLCERAGWAEDARAYNEIITSWSAIESAATRIPSPKQGVLFGT
jgi:putative DNA methylase